MQLNYIYKNGLRIAELVSDDVEINEVQDALDLLGNADYNDAKHILAHEHNFCPEFFDLKTKLAGEILQKFANYHMKLAIVGEFNKYESKSLQAFIIECNRGSHIFFSASREEALEKFTKYQI